MYAASEKKRHQVANLAWCALIALHMARKHRLTEQDKHDFLVNWLKKAYADISIHTEVKEDIGWFLQQAAVHGKKAYLVRKLTYVWHMTTGQMIDNADMLKLTRAINFAQSLGWRYRLQEETNLFNCHNTELSVTNIIIIFRLSLDDAFNSYGKQVRPVKACIKGNINSMKEILRGFQWDIMTDTSGNFLRSSDEYDLVTTDKAGKSGARST